MPAIKHLCEIFIVHLLKTSKNQRNDIIGSFMGTAFSLEFQISSPSSPPKKNMNKAIHHPNEKTMWFGVIFQKTSRLLGSSLLYLTHPGVKRCNQRSSSASTVFSRPVSGSGAAAVTIQGCFKPSFGFEQFGRWVFGWTCLKNPFVTAKSAGFEALLLMESSDEGRSLMGLRWIN